MFGWISIYINIYIFVYAGVEDMLGEDEFNKALYIFDIGQNDLVAALDTLSFNQALQRIPSLISEIEVAMWVSNSNYQFILFYVIKIIIYQA